MQSEYSKLSTIANNASLETTMSIFHLASLQDEFDESASQAVLPEFKPHFFVPPMLDKPQNPIMDTLKLHSPTVPVPTPLRLGLPTELASLTFDIQPQGFSKPNDSIWADALKGGLARSVSSLRCIPSLGLKKTGNIVLGRPATQLPGPPSP